MYKSDLAESEQHTRLSLQSKGLRINFISDSIEQVFLRLHNDICLNCFAPNLETVNRVFSNQCSPPVLIVGSYTYESSLRKSLEKNSLEEMHYINLGNNNYILPADSANAPYLFTIDTNSQVKDLFFIRRKPDINISEFNELIKRKLSERIEN